MQIVPQSTSELTVSKKLRLLPSGCTPNFIDFMKEKFEDTKGVIGSHKLKKDRENNGQKKKDKQRSTKHYTEKIEQHEPHYKRG